MNLIFLLITTFSTIALDRITKYWALKTLSTESITLFPGFNFSLSWNKGISWSLLSPDTPMGFWILTGAITCLITVLVIVTGKHMYDRTATAFEMMLLGGALSNLCDRFCYGAVLDFIQWHWQDWYWPTFNVADAAIVCGVIGIVVHNWWSNHD